MIKPVGKRVLVRLQSQEQVSGGGLVLTKAAQTAPTQGKVEALGHLVTADDLVSEGDTVLFGDYAGVKVTHDAVDYLVIELDDILAILG